MQFHETIFISVIFQKIFLVLPSYLAILSGIAMFKQQFSVYWVFDLQE